MRILLLVAAGMVTAAVFAQPQPPQGGASGARRGPPPEALKACEGRKSGDACSFTSPRGKAEGSCWAPDTSKPLACRPKDAPPGPPPQGKP
jgi:hypothetical protein